MNTLSLLKREISLDRILSLPFFRKYEDKVSDIAAEILAYRENGIQDYLTKIGSIDENLGIEANEAFMQYAKALTNQYWSALQWAAGNDTYDKLTSILELGGTATIIGIPVVYLHRAASLIGPLGANIALRQAVNKMRPHSGENAYRDQMNFLNNTTAGLVAAEGAEFIPALGELAGLASDTLNLYVMAFNGTVAIGARVETFEKYLIKKHPGLYESIQNKVFKQT